MSEERIRDLEERAEKLEGSHRTQVDKLVQVDAKATRADDNANEAKRIANDAVATMNNTHRSMVEHVGRAIGGVTETVEKSIDRLDDALNKRLDKQDELVETRLDSQDSVQVEHGTKLEAIHTFQVQAATREATIAEQATLSRKRIMSTLKFIGAVLTVPPAAVAAVIAFHAIGVWLHHVVPSLIP